MILRGQIYSKAIEMQTGITVLIPTAALGKKQHKVAYLLHGLYGSSGDWLDYTMLPIYAEKYDIVFVMPEVARSFYTDMVHGQKFFSYVSEELPEICGNVFHLSSYREDTLVAGASMGGYGALKCAFTRPERYGYCAAISSACLFLKEGLDYQRENGMSEELEKRHGKQLLKDFESIFGPDLVWKPENEVLELVRTCNAKFAKPKLYLACGKDDYLYQDNRRFVSAIDSMRYPFAFEEWKGSHDWYFFNAALEKALIHFFGDGSEKDA
jgi:putative tributyrin esterase